MYLATLALWGLPPPLLMNFDECRQNLMAIHILQTFTVVQLGVVAVEDVVVFVQLCAGFHMLLNMNKKARHIGGVTEFVRSPI
jgi:hypothetical protein